MDTIVLGDIVYNEHLQVIGVAEALVRFCLSLGG